MRVRSFRSMISMFLVTLLVVVFAVQVQAYTATEAATRFATLKSDLAMSAGHPLKVDTTTPYVFRYQAIEGTARGMYEPPYNRYTMDPAKTSTQVVFDYTAQHEVGHAYMGWYLGDWSEGAADDFAWCFGNSSARSMYNSRFNFPPDIQTCSNIQEAINTAYWGQ